MQVARNCRRTCSRCGSVEADGRHHRLRDRRRRMKRLRASFGTCFVGHYGSSTLLARGEFTQRERRGLDAAGGRRRGPVPPAGRLADRRRMREHEASTPAPAGPFGRLTFSHDLIHKIGGDDDTNRNTTQRHAAAAGIRADRQSRRLQRRRPQRAARGTSKKTTARPGDTPFRVPRFLLNDVARYWRTMAVDFAQSAASVARRRVGAAQRQAPDVAQAHVCGGAAQLLLVRVHESGPNDREAAWQSAAGRVSTWQKLVRKTPLDIVAGAVLSYSGNFRVRPGKLFGAYDEFMGLLDDGTRRDAPRGARPLGAETDPEY